MQNQESKSVTAEQEAEPRARAAAGHMPVKPAVGTGQMQLFLLYFGAPMTIREQRHKKSMKTSISMCP